LSEQIAADLTRDVHAGQIEPGTRLPTEAVLGARYGVSRSAVREAMSMLRSNGVIESRRGSGSFVVEAPTVALAHKLPEPGLDAVIEIFELRRALETDAAGLAAERANRAQRSRIRNALIEIEEADEAGESGVAQDLAFHRAIAEAANNDYFVMVLDFYSRFLFRAISVSRGNEARRSPLMAQVVAEHEAIVAAITVGDSGAARAAAAAHMDNGMRRLRDMSPALRRSLETGQDLDETCT
tara:strand:+ start:230 stop:949 length:720 start_codon:yes stop_codon:yes gene_type:complete